MALHSSATCDSLNGTAPLIATSDLGISLIHSECCVCLLVSFPDVGTDDLCIRLLILFASDLCSMYIALCPVVPEFPTITSLL